MGMFRLLYSGLFYLTNHMLNGSKRVMEHHPWSQPPHHLSDPLLHLWSIAMNGAFLAGGLLLTKTASVKSAVGIFQKLLAAGAQLCVSLFLAAVKTYHLFHHLLLFLYAFACRSVIFLCR